MDTRRTFVGKLLAAFSFPALISKLFSTPVKVPSKLSPPPTDIMPSMEVLDQQSGLLDFDTNRLTLMEFLEKSSGRKGRSDPAPRIVPQGRKMRQSPDSKMFELKEGCTYDLD